MSESGFFTVAHPVRTIDTTNTNFENNFITFTPFALPFPEANQKNYKTSP